MNIILNSAKENRSAYALLHIINDTPVSCMAIPDAFEKEHYICKFDGMVSKLPEARKTPMVAIDFYEKEKMFYVSVAPKVPSKLMPMDEYLYNTQDVLPILKNRDKQKHWVVLLQEKAPKKEFKKAEVLDFPVEFLKEQKPYVGALDLNGAPISYAQTKDISLYLDIKKDFESEDYEGVLKSVKRVIEHYPNSIFKSELELYNIRSMDRLANSKDDQIAKHYDHNEVVKLARSWIKEFSGDENIPEVLLYISKSYLKLGLTSDANYFIDILVSEHPQSEYTKKAILIFADSLYVKNKKDKALKLYSDVLYSSQNVDIASEAAIRLTAYNIDAGRTKEAKEYLLKVLNANSVYLLRDKEETYALAQKLYVSGLFDVAARVLDLLLSDMDKKNELREEYLKESGDWHVKANDVPKAYDRYKEYLNEYKNGSYLGEVEEKLDALFFDLKENNETKLENYYDKLIGSYDNKIGDRATIEKGKLLLKQKRFYDVLEMEDALRRSSDGNNSEIETIINTSAQSLARDNLENDKCIEAISLIEKYKIDFFGIDDESRLHACLMRLSRFDNAKEVSSSHLNDAKIEDKFFWIKKEVLALYKMGKYKEVVALKKDIFTLWELLKTPLELQVMQSILSSHLQLKQQEEALAMADVIEKNYNDNFSNIDIYADIVKTASDLKDDLVLSRFAKKLLDLQEKHNSHLYSPSVEFSYIESLKRLNQNAQALSVTEKLLSISLHVKEKARALYTAGELSMKLKDIKKAEEYFIRCVDTNETSSWKNICGENLKLF
ncbi:MAG: hypothetical protein PHW07_01090 [Sulfurospirillaceae bacterium]|nr:hypothetical protein [Sulfurospirillaceae bacterium]